MSTKYLGETFDITARHGPQIPHHECEIAQNVGPRAELLDAGNMLTVNGRKMAKSEGNGFTLTSSSPATWLLDKGPPMTVRFSCSWVTTPAHSTATTPCRLQRRDRKLEKAIETLGDLKPWPATTASCQAFADKCHAAMNDDFNTPICTTLFEGVKAINNGGFDHALETDIDTLAQTFHTFTRDVLGIKAETAGRRTQEKRAA